MKRMKILITLSLSMIAFSGFGQYYSFDQLVGAGDDSYEAGNYNKALAFYSEALKQNDDLNDEVNYRLGHSAYEVRSLNTADQYLSLYLENEEAAHTPQALSMLGKLKHLQGDYESARTYYNLYISEYSEEESEEKPEMEFLLGTASWADTAMIENTVDTVRRLDKLNSPESDLSPYYMDESIYFSSLRDPIEDDEFHRYRSGIYKETMPVEISGLPANKFAAHPTFTDEGKLMFFSICEYVSEYEIECKIHRASVDSLGQLSNVNILSEDVNKTGYTSTQPSVVSQEDGYMLYFSSDRIGGKGKSDIWSVKLDKEFNSSPAKNLKDVNTEREEITPFYHQDSETLYFSSNGHNGYGGYDVFYLNDENKNPQNAGKKINTSYEDIFYFLDPKGGLGFLSSNRPGSMYAESSYETCCFDIYEVKHNVCTIDLLALTFDEKTKEPLENVSIKVLDPETNELIAEANSDSNESELEVPCDQALKLIASREGYEDLELMLDPMNGEIGGDNDVTKELFLMPKTFGLTVTILEELEMEAVNGAQLFLTDLSTNEQIAITDNPGNIFDLDIRPNTDYLIEVNKPGFKEGSVKFNSGDGLNSVNKQIVLEYLDIVHKSMASLENAIPVSLYFDNDAPRKGSTAEVSGQSYTETYEKYYTKKDKFKNAYFKLFKGSSDKETANQEVEYLFENKVKYGFDRYENFKNQLLIVLKDGVDVNIYLRGYTSPIAQSDYNVALGKRRIDSVRKEFYSWRNGTFIPYLESGQLKVTERSFGESTADTTISDDPRSPSRSIFSPEASLERRVEIDEINFEGN